MKLKRQNPFTALVLIMVLVIPVSLAAQDLSDNAEESGATPSLGTWRPPVFYFQDELKVHHVGILAL